MRVSMLAIGLFPFVSAAFAAPAEFPYEAVVESDGVVVRSGPGERYDPTLKLGTGQQITVHRHDPGGWFMISPPPGSFSWIDGTYVEKTGPETGTVRIPSSGEGLPPRVVVWIGSQFTDEHKYFGRQLAHGDEVRILGEKQGQTDRGATTFYKIAPPRLEYRWIKGDSVVPLSQASRIARTPPVATPPVSNNPQKINPFANPLAGTGAMPAPGFPPDQGPALLERELTRGIDSSSKKSSPSTTGTTTAERTQLFALDDQLKSMLARTPDHWDLTGMEQAYRQLQSTAGASVAAQIESRLAAIESRKKIKAEYDEFVGVMTQTEQRDAALLSMQQSIATGVPLSALQVELGQPSAIPPGSAAILPPSSSAGTATQDAVPQMDGAGIVQRLPRPALGLPQHVLVAPDGRLLSYLRPGEGVRLDDYVGKSMGVIGRRSHDARLRSDIIVVESLTPVQLQP